MNRYDDYSLWKRQKFYITGILKNNKELWDQKQNKNETEVEKKPKQCDVNKQVNIRSTIEVPDRVQLTARHVPLRYSSFHNALQARKRNHKYGKCTQDISTEGFDFKIKLFSVGISGECGSVVSQELRSCLLGQKDTYKYQLVENKGELEFNS